jgi:hypothetical protein
VIVEVLVAQRQAEDALPHQRLQPVLDIARVAPVGEARGKPTRQPEAPIHLSQQKRPGIRGDVPASEARNHAASFNRFKIEQLRRTLCRHRGVPVIREKLLWHNTFLRFSAPMHSSCLRNPG